MKKFVRNIALAVASAPLMLSIAVGATFPDRPITIVVPYAPGGSTDHMGRMIGVAMSRELHQTVIVQNKPGANASLGNAFVAKALPDGYTLLLGNTSTVMNQFLYRSLPYQEKDLVPVAIINEFPLVLVVNEAVPANNVAEFVAYAKQKQGKLNFASAGFGNSTHLAGELFKIRAGIDMTHVPYNGSIPGDSAVMAGDVQAFFDTTVTVLPFIKSGKMKALAVTSRDRLPVLPGVPTVMETYPAFGAVTSWQGIFAPIGTPPEVMKALRTAVNATMTDPKNRKSLEEEGGVFLPVDTNGVSSKKYFAEERTKWKTIIETLGVKLEN